MKIDMRLLKTLPYMRIYLAVIVALSLLTSIGIVMQARYLTMVISAVMLEHQTLYQVAWPLSLLLLILIGRACLPWLSEVVTQRAATTVKNILRLRLFEHILSLGPRYVNGERSGELTHSLTEGIEAFDAYFSQIIPQICATVLVPGVILLIVFSVDALSGIVLLVTLPVLPFFMILIGKRAEKATQQRWHTLSQMSAHFLDVLQGATTLKLFGRSKAQQATIGQISEQFGRITMGVLRIAFLSALVMEMGATISTALVAVEIGLRLLYGQMPFTQAFFVLLLTPEFFQPLRALGPQFHASMESVASAQRMFSILDTPVLQSPTTPQTEQDTLIEPHVLRFEHVHYTYNTTEGNRPALQDISFQAKRGQKIAIIGPSGAGKSTLASLLLRFIEPEQGKICFDGIPLSTYTAQDWRKRIAWQPQRPSLFNMTVAENIRMGKPEATEAEVIQAAQQAHIHEFIQTLPQGYDTIIGERGMRLSGGQAQRLALARALIKDAPILLLDEPTSTLDAEVETNIHQTLATCTTKRIVLIIAHRLNTIRSADLIVLLHEGRIIDCGTHQALQQRSTLYQQMLQAYAHEEIAA